MKKGKRENYSFFCVVALILFLAGCATARLSNGPDIFALQQHSGIVNVGVTKVVDERKTPNIETIGAAGIRVKQADLSNLATNYLIYNLNSALSVNVS